MAENFKKILNTELDRIKNLGGPKPRLLLHACCAPCSSYVVALLSGHFEITVFFHNPNIDTEEEYVKRADELRRLIEEQHPDLGIIVPEYDSGPFLRAAAGHEGEPENGARCPICFKLRLETTAKEAAAGRFDFFATTLTVSPHKNAAAINEIGLELSEKYGVRYLVSDFKKDDGYKKSVELSRKYNLYRQNYCGCVFTKDREKL